MMTQSEYLIAGQALTSLNQHQAVIDAQGEELAAARRIIARLQRELAASQATVADLRLQIRNVLG